MYEASTRGQKLVIKKLIKKRLHWLNALTVDEFKGMPAQYITQLFVQHVSAGLCQPQPPPMPTISCTRRPRRPSHKKKSATALVASPSQDQLRGTRCRHHSAMTNCLSLHFAVYTQD